MTRPDGPMNYAVKLFAAHPRVKASIHCCDSDQKHSVATDRLPKLRRQCRVNYKADAFIVVLVALSMFPETLGALSVWQEVDLYYL